VSDTGGERIPSRIGPRQIPLDDLLPHPLNSNVMAPEYREKLLAHIRRTGRYPFLVVRPYPGEPGRYEVLDGHHRVSILRELGHAEARCDVWDVDDREAKLLLATLNRLEGQDLPLRRAQLLHELLGEWSATDLGGLLPENEAEILDLHSLLEFPAEEIADQLMAEAEEQEKTLPVVIHFVVSHEQAELIDTAIERASDGTAGRDRKARGLANLAKHFLEGGAHAAR
jgi:ParB-like chromosome segregation protein Spo0J